jgi:ubiquinone/menaquinone biosynthesis C-methylase UbiE
MASEVSSLTFDRAADYYDKTRGLPPDAKAGVVRVLADELGGRRSALEIGVGTGRIALALHEVGMDITGVDLSEPMLRRLVDNAGGTIPFPLARADAIAMPFADNSFGAAYTCHVLHLIPEWEAVLDDVARVVSSGGVYLDDLGGWSQMSGPRRNMMEIFATEAGFAFTPRGAGDVEDVDRVMISAGAAVRPLPTVMFENSDTYSNVIEHLERGTWSCTWQTSADARAAAGRKLRKWAEDRYGDLSKTFEYSVPIEWRAYDLP